MAEFAKVDAHYTFVERYPAPICGNLGGAVGMDGQRGEVGSEERCGGAVRELLYLRVMVAGDGESEGE